MNERIKKLEIEVSYLRKELEELKSKDFTEIHTHYHYDYSKMSPMIINDLKGLKDFTDNLEEPLY